MAWYGSDTAEWAALVSALLLLGLVNQPQLRLVSSAVGTALGGAYCRPLLLIVSSVHAPQGVGGRLRRGWFYGRMLGLPLLALGIFQTLFAVANPRYGALSAQVWRTIGAWLDRVLAAISGPHVLFFIACGLVAMATLVVVPVHFFSDYEARFGEWVRRQRNGGGLVWGAATLTSGTPTKARSTCARSGWRPW